MMTMPMVLEQERAEISAKVGSDVKIERPQWAALMQRGVLVKLHIRRWRAKARITLEDLGLPTPKDDDEQRVYDELMSLGDKKLLPPERLRELDSLESAARKHLEKLSFKTYWGSWVAFTAYDEWKTGDAEYEAGYLAIRDSLARDFDNIVSALVDAYRVAAHVSYQRLSTLNPRGLMIDGVMITEGEFVAAFMRRIRSAIPTKEQVYDSFGYEREISFIPLPSQLAENAARAQKIDLEREQEYREFVELRSVEREKQQALARMNSDVVGEARRMKEQLVGGFFRDIEVQLRGVIYDDLVNVLESIGRNDGNLLGKSSSALRNIVKRVRVLNFTENEEIEAQIGAVEQVMTLSAKERSSAEVRELLRQIAVAQRGALLDLGAEPRTARAVGVPDEIPEVELRRAAGASWPTRERTMDYACLEPNYSLKDNSQGITRYCKVCEALQGDRCCRGTAEGVRARLEKRIREAEGTAASALCTSCGCRPAAPGRRTCAFCLVTSRDRRVRRRERLQHACAWPGCTAQTMGRHCKRHARRFREGLRRGLVPEAVYGAMSDKTEAKGDGYAGNGHGGGCGDGAQGAGAPAGLPGSG